MTVIKIETNENNQHFLESQSHRTECWLDGYIAVPSELEQKAWDCFGYCDLVINEDGVLTDILPKEIPVDLDGIKEQKILQSKVDLQTYLAEHPLQWTDGKYYTITAEKQQQLTSKLLSATFAQQTGTEYDLKWNDTEQVCEPWTLENLTALAFAIDARVTALVTYQQEKERQIRDAETLETLESIVVNYDEVV